MAKQPVPISLRIRAAEVNNRARKLLHRLNEEDRLQRRVRLLAMKALASIREMHSVASPKLKSMYPADSDRWQKNVRSIEASLLKMTERGVG